MALMDVYGEYHIKAAGTLAPRFILRDQEGTSITLDQLINDGMALLFFYSRDGHPGVSKELAELDEFYGKFREFNISPVAISSDDEKTHSRFAKKHDFTLPLLADPDFEVAKQYGVWNENGNNTRVTFLINQDQEIVRVYPFRRLRSHVKELYTNVMETLVD